MGGDGGEEMEGMEWREEMEGMEWEVMKGRRWK